MLTHVFPQSSAGSCSKFGYNLAGRLSVVRWGGDRLTSASSLTSDPEVVPPM